MALFRTYSAALHGIDAHVIDVEVDMYPAGTSRDFVTVGMPDAAVRESRERIKSALLNSGFGYPSKSVTINLAPANLRKEGAGFDLPMATAILGAMGTVSKTEDDLLIGGAVALADEHRAQDSQDDRAEQHEHRASQVADELFVQRTNTRAEASAIGRSMRL